MLKYRIDVLPTSHYLRVVKVVWVATLCLSAWFWKPDILPFQWFYQVLASVFIYVLCMRFIRFSALADNILMDDQGNIALPPFNEQQWQISARSRTLGPFIYLVVNNRFDCDACFAIWLARDQVSQRGFCRLCKVIIRCQTSSIHPSELKH